MLKQSQLVIFYKVDFVLIIGYTFEKIYRREYDMNNEREVKGKKGKGCLIVVLVTLGSVIALFFGLLAIGNSMMRDFEPSEQITQNASQTNVTLSSVEDEVEVVAFEPYEEINKLSVGDTVTFNNWDITLNSFEFTDRISTSGSFFYSPSEGNTYLYAVVTVTNRATGPRTFLPMFPSGSDIRTNIIYDDTFTFSRINLLTYRECLEGRSTNPLAPTTGSLIYSIADLAAQSDGSLILRLFNDRDEIVFTLR